MTARLPAVLLVGGLISFAASASVALTASNAVDASSVGYELRAQGSNDLKPAGCPGTLVSLVTGDTLIVGTGASELILGSPGVDTISGGAGDDCIVGGDGDDVLHGGPDFDTCMGGPGADTFPGGECEVPIQ